ncbi:Uncharacterized protein APZ42_027691 [Daphnia magna]|uniref:Uncharacterized protein n=1 Tax=Daphnia magna TaxID=35525 RepID=A0A164R6E7_9CRUS|nr:Uncharacterized protein APZ42_027691 [Daphnia magna]
MAHTTEDTTPTPVLFALLPSSLPTPLLMVTHLSPPASTTDRMSSARPVSAMPTQDRPLPTFKMLSATKSEATLTSTQRVKRSAFLTPPIPEASASSQTTCPLPQSPTW